MIKDENVRIMVTIPKKLQELLQKDADYDDRSVSYIAAKILKKHYRFKDDDD